MVTCDEKIILRDTLVSEKRLNYINFKRFEKALVYIKNNLIDSDNIVYLTVDSLIDINSLITVSNFVTLRIVTVKPYRCDKMSMHKELIENKLHELINQFTERKIIHRDFYFALVTNIHPFYDEHGRVSKILFCLQLGKLKTNDR